MKAKITHHDGTVIEAEGTAEEIAALARRDEPIRFVGGTAALGTGNCPCTTAYGPPPVGARLTAPVAPFAVGGY